MHTNQIIALAAIGASIALVVWLLVGFAVGAKRAFPAGVAGPARRRSRRHRERYLPDPRYFIGLAALMFGLGFLGSVQGGLILGIASIVILYLTFKRSGALLTDDKLVLGTMGEKVTIDLDDIGAVVLAPKGAVGRSRGSFGLVDRQGGWIAPLRYSTMIRGVDLAAAVICSVGLEPAGVDRIWNRDGVEIPKIPIPFVAR